MTDKLSYVVWYHKVFGSTLRGRKALGYYGSYKELYDAFFEDRDEMGILDAAPAGKYTSFSAVDAERVIAECEKNGWSIITSDSPFYPQQLISVADRPHLLFCEGKKEILSRAVKVAIVGSREAAPEAEVIAYNSAYNLAKTGAVIVSGAALGIDSSSHLGAIESGGETIGVLGCGLGSSYMNRVGDFYDKLLTNGVYVTEMFPYVNASRYSFPERNRIISGMSQAVLVTCAAEKSGSLITAESARKQKRRVYAIAPEICYSPGCEQLIKDGAYTFYNAGDIAYPLKEHFPENSFNESYCNRPVTLAAAGVVRESMVLPGKKKKSEKETVNTKTEATVKNDATVTSEHKKKTELPSYLSEDALKIYELLGKEALPADMLCNISGLPVNIVLIAVSELETENLVKTGPGGRIEKI